MKRVIKHAAILAVVTLVAPAVLAATTTTWIPAVRSQNAGETVQRPNIPVDPDPVRMHGTKNGAGSGSSFATEQARTTGPALLGSDELNQRGSALVTPTGSGPMYSPKQQGDREIQRLIRQLG